MASNFFTFLQLGMLALRSTRSRRIGFTMALMGKKACSGKMAYSGMLASEIIGSRHRNELKIFAFNFILLISICFP